jgi:hypothetical protein
LLKKINDDKYFDTDGVSIEIVSPSGGVFCEKGQRMSREVTAWCVGPKYRSQNNWEVWAFFICSSSVGRFGHSSFAALQ